jgi:hypothetical protein
MGARQRGFGHGYYFSAELRVVSCHAVDWPLRGSIKLQLVVFGSARCTEVAAMAPSSAFRVLIRGQVTHIFFLWIWLLGFAHI